MEIVTRWTLAAQATYRWEKQYENKPHLPWALNILDQLKELGPNPHPDRVDEVIGNKTWTKVPACDACQAEKLESILLIDDTEEPERRIHVCGRCLLKGLEMLEEG